MGFIYAGLLYLLSRLLKDFIIQPGGIASVAIILMIADVVVYYVLRAVSMPLKIASLGLLIIPLNWLINVAIIWIVDKLSNKLEVKSFSSLAISGILLSLAHFLKNRLF